MRIWYSIGFSLLLAFGVAAAQEDDLCVACHEEAVDPAAYAASVHGEMGFACVDCHESLAGTDDFPHAEELPAVDCSMCHEDAQEDYASSLHGYARSRGNERAPDCAACHGSHEILSSADPRSPVNRANVPATCASCHGTGLLTDQIVKLPETVAAYAKSVHGNGNGHVDAEHAGAVCIDCHGTHALRGSADPESMIHRSNVAETCGRCHEQERDDCNTSIHGRALAAGVSDSPTCTDCHGEHLILSPQDPGSGTSAGRLAEETCGQCHNDPVIIAKYNLRGGVVGTYEDSYHGWAVRRNSDRAATCVSCHSAHKVLPQQHPDSTVHPDNVVATCGQCHKRADKRFAASYTHETTSLAANPVKRWIRSVYMVLIVVTIGGMLVHNGLILNYYLVQRKRAIEAGTTVQRLDGIQILQHMGLAVSFVGLALTGFALRFPNAGWARALTYLGMTEPVRANLHRILAVVLVAVGLSHVVYVVWSRRGRQEFLSMLPARSDALDARDNLWFHTWRSPLQARFGRYDYTQKLEYWALIWGTVLMAVTGAVLWFPETAARFLPSWIIPASETVHYYEAWLATLAILVWHLFFVVFHPAHYPMDWTWLTGKMGGDFVQHHHGRWYADEIAQKPETVSDKKPASKKRSARRA